MSALSVKRTLATVGLTAVETAIVKATFDDDELPKAKHIRTICDHVDLELTGSGYDTSSNNLTLVEMFRKRVNRVSNSSLTWKVSIKSLITIHLLLRQCDIAFIDELTQYGQAHHRIFDLTNRYSDNTNSNTIVHSTFVRKYSRYLQEKLIVYKEIDFNVERKVAANNKDFFAVFDVNTLGKILPLIMKQLDCVLEVIPQLDSTSFIIHPLEKQAMLLLIKDSLKIYSSVQLILWQLIQSFQELNTKQAKWVSATYQSYFDLNTRYKQWFLVVVKLGIVNHQFAPKFDTLPETLAHKLKQYISDQEDNPSVKRKKSKKKRKKKEPISEEHEETQETEETEELKETNEMDLFGFEDLLNIQPTHTSAAQEFNDGLQLDDWWNSNTVADTAISGGAARALKKENTTANNEDPFMDLLNLNSNVL
eukprot:693648_1